ncbi:hypothetical protein I3842_Q019000 [Carya illinoinensis]|uniref:Histidine-containing phosphotransfer protein n=1 Tax=Carya illinoinensis TaxID=32201 RepID=A0A922D0L1_CARIL|nr:hypothetical protein I3842_Q019000 [Carya illinoinensis]
MDVMIQLQIQLREHSAFLHKEGYLDDQFEQLQKLQDENSPDFVVEVVSIFFDDSEKLLNNLAKALEQKDVDFKQVDAHVHQFKGSSASIGAMRVKNACIEFRNYCEAQNIEECLTCMQKLQFEYSVLKNQLEYLFRLEQQIQAARV